MAEKSKKTWLIPILITALFAVTATFYVQKRFNGRDLKGILESGRIVMITQNNANTYYIDRDEPRGFEFELAAEFARYLGVELEVITPGWSNMIEALRSGEGDFIAAGMTITPGRMELVDFSGEYLRVQQQIIVHKDDTQLLNMEDLNGRTVHLREETSYQDRLMELKEEGLRVSLELWTDIPTEEFIRQVAEKEIGITVADSNIAFLNRRYYPDIRIPFPIQEEESLGWAVRKGHRDLLNRIDAFFNHIRGNGFYERVYEHYYGNVEIFEYLDLKVFHRRVDRRLPRYEDLIRREAERYGLDWRLVAAVIYQESHFNPRARSYTGVRGLMQVTRRTAREMGFEDRLNPEKSVRAGTKYLARLYGRFNDLEDPRDRMLFTLASYNVGYGHVRDAQRIAETEGLDPVKWSSLSQTLPLLRFPKYYRKAAYGYARGTEPVRFVERVQLYYDILRWKTAYEPV